LSKEFVAVAEPSVDIAVLASAKAGINASAVTKASAEQVFFMELTVQGLDELHCFHEEARDIFSAIPKWN
jgi:hypothetical protein